MRTLTLSALLAILAVTAYSQNVVFKIEKNTFAPEKTPIVTDFSKEFTIEVSGAGCTDFKVTALDDDPKYTLTQKGTVFSVSAVPTDLETISISVECKEVKMQKFDIKKGNPEEEQKQKEEALKKKRAEEEARRRQILAENSLIEAVDYFLKTQPTIYNSPTRYNRKEDKAYFLFGSDGTLLGPAPVNVDADDNLIILVAVPKTEDWQYSVEVEGTYNPSDLSLRPSDPIDQAIIESTNKPEDWTIITRTFGPFTSEFAKISIKKNGELLTKTDVRINKLYNVAFGASFITTNLEKPDFDVFPLDSAGNTINTVNSGSRTLATFNVILYWKSTVQWALGELKGKDHITRGRDVLKEADFWERLNPTFGVTLDSKWRKNLFVGATFEIARGANLIGGWHYGEVQKLADPNFELGTTSFTGTKADIKLTNEMEWGAFFGLTLDTKIFNRVFKRS